ncbi:MAG: hypothetical protein ABI045_00580 [Flavobacteriales bacterium]
MRLLGTLYLFYPNIHFSKKEKIYSVNKDSYVHFPQGVKDFIKYCQKEEEDRPYTAGHTGSLVADFHRNMIKNGNLYLFYQYRISTRKSATLVRIQSHGLLGPKYAGGRASWMDSHKS